MVLTKTPICNFDETNVLEMLIYLVKKKNAYIEYFSGLENRDIHFALRKN